MSSFCCNEDHEKSPFKFLPLAGQGQTHTQKANTRDGLSITLWQVAAQHDLAATSKKLCDARDRYARSSGQIFAVMRITNSLRQVYSPSRPKLLQTRQTNTQTKPPVSRNTPVRFSISRSTRVLTLIAVQHDLPANCKTLSCTGRT